MYTSLYDRLFLGHHIFTKLKEGSFFEGHHVRRCPFLRPKASEDQKKVISSADVHFSAQKLVKTKKKIITSTDVYFSAQKLVKTKKRSSRRQMSIFPPKTSEDQKKGHHIRRPAVCTETFRNFSWKNDLTCFHRSQCRKGGHLTIYWRPFWSKRRTCPPKGGCMVSLAIL